MTKQLNIGVVGLENGWSTSLLMDALEKKTGNAIFLSSRDLCLDFHQGVYECKGYNLLDLDAILIKKLDEVYSPSMLDQLEILAHLERKGVKIFSKTESISRLINRLHCTLLLQEANVPMPPTVITQNMEEAANAVERLESVILKPLYSTKARGMQMIHSQDGKIEEQLCNFKNAGNDLFYIQQKIDLPGRDLGVVFLGEEYLGTYARVGNDDSWNTTIHDGGKYASHESSDEILAIARRARDAFGLEFTCVDVAETSQGPVVFEVSAFGGFRGLTEGLDIPIAKLYVEHVLKKLEER